MVVTATLTTNPEITRILVRAEDDVVLKAALLPRGWPPHRRALPTLLEALALWHQVPVRAVISASDLGPWSTLGLVDDLDGGAATVHYTVEARVPGRRRGQRIRGLGSFVEMQQFDLRGDW
jgi:hypothetical protein